MKSCDNCLYGKLCCPERMTICTDFEDKRLYHKFTWHPNQEAYLVFCGQVHKVTVRWVNMMYTAHDDIREVVWYDFYGELLNYDPDSTHHSNPLYHTREDAEEALTKGANDEQAD